MEAGTRPTGRAVKPAPTPSEPREGADLIRAAARDEQLTDEEQSSALEWFLSADDAEAETEVIQLNVGSRSKEKWVDWEIRPVDLDTLRRIRRAAQGSGTRAQQRRNQQTGDVDETEANLRIVIEGTVDPDFKVVAKQTGIADPADALRRRFTRKPGLLAQIAGEIMSISGYDDEDIRTVESASNS